MARLHLPAFSTILLLLLPVGSVRAAEGGDEARVAQLEAAIDAAVDERGVPAPEQFALRVELARLILADLAAEEPGDENAIQEAALENLRVAAELGDLDPDLTLWLARQELAAGRTAAASHHLRSVVERARSSEAALMLVEISRERGRHKVALDHARQAVDLAASDLERARTLNVFMDVAETVGVSGEAMVAAERLMDLEPDSWRHPWRLARILASQGKTDEAVEVLGRTLELADARGEDAWPARRDLGVALVAEDRYDEARPHLEVFLEVDPSDHDAQAALAQVEERVGDVEAAAARARRVLDAAPDHAGALLVMGRVQASSGDFESARALLESAVARDPDSKKAHYQLSLACARLRDRECAERHLARYQELQNAAENVVEMTRMSGGGDGR